MQFKGKLMHQARENRKKTNFEPDFGSVLAQIWFPKFFLWVLPLLDVKKCCKLSLYAIPRKTKNQT